MRDQQEVDVILGLIASLENKVDQIAVSRVPMVVGNPDEELVNSNPEVLQSLNRTPEVHTLIGGAVAVAVM